VLEDEALKHGPGDGLLVGVEVVDGLELKLECFVWATFSLVEHELVGCDRQGDGKTAQDLEGRQSRGGLVAKDLREVHADFVGEVLLREGPLFAESNESF